MNKLNPAYKFLIIFIYSMLLSFKSSIFLNISTIILCILLLVMTSRVRVKSIVIGVVPFLFAAIGLFFTGLMFSKINSSSISALESSTVIISSMDTAIQLSSRVLAFGSIAMLFSLTTEPSEFIMSLMQQFKMPPKFAYGILASYHFLPVVKNEYWIVKSSLKVRGVKANPISTKILIPMIVHAFERSESIAMAMESRGFCSEADRSIAFPIEVRKIDYAFISFSFVLIIFCIVVF